MAKDKEISDWLRRVLLEGEQDSEQSRRTRVDIDPEKVKATELLSNGLTMLEGISAVLGREVNASEISQDEVLQQMFNPVLTAEDRYALLLMKKGLDPKETNSQS